MRTRASAAAPSPSTQPSGSEPAAPQQRSKTPVRTRRAPSKQQQQPEGPASPPLQSPPRTRPRRQPERQQPEQEPPASQPASPRPMTRKARASTGAAAAAAAAAAAVAAVATSPPKPPGGWPGQHPLRIESAAAFWVLAVGPLLVWWLAVFSGISAYDGLPVGGRKVRHALLWFDKGLLRPAGALLPFAILAARLAVNAAADALSGDEAAAAAAAARRRRGRGQLGTLAWSCGWLYSLIALARILLYLSHYYAMRGSLFAEHLVSDHLFLGGTIMVCLQSEAVCLVSDALRGLEARVTAREAGLTATFVAALFLYLCTAADMYFTARFYHYPLESFATTIAVFLLFQAPVIRWLRNSWRRAPAGAAAPAAAPFAAGAPAPALAAAQ
ncbi:hypothetical protein Rsub_05702 [Raphidocelis subcapitata]|uniref:Uncharacterized protein n=1 Tax=Raphidocelis subcapitata TaxID=307507 RepID=A0A2V0NZM6_9CHLO|nr:hypothetical protein Rsub_05702 [Raphidocelis subcapitata]|eukprot:GBF93091.1 hypothetical protein Rsub_05702 [Raphidocelis subcapitata]